MDRFEQIIEHSKRNALYIENAGKLPKRDFFSIAKSEFDDDYGLALVEMIKAYFELKGNIPDEEWNALRKEAEEFVDDNSVRYS